MLEDCYFYIDSGKQEEEQNLDILCMTCHEKYPDLGWFWQGSKHGYGPYDFICSKCNHVIFSPAKNQRGASENPETRI